MNRDNISVLVVSITVIYFLFGFTIYFNNPDLNKIWPIQQKDKDMLGTWSSFT